MRRYKVLLDSDVMFDFISARLPFYDNARSLFTLAENGVIDTYTLPHLIINVWQIKGHMRISGQEMKKSLRNMVRLVGVLDERKQSIINAINLDRPDLEDSVTLESAVDNRMDFIITRNVRHFKNDLIPVLSPKQFLIEHFPNMS